MSASNRSVIQKSCRSILGDQRITAAERLKATTILWRLEASAKKGKPRGRPFPKASAKRDGGTNQRLEEILATIQQPVAG
jgi:hypothetical protein